MKLSCGSHAVDMDLWVYAFVCCCWDGALDSCLEAAFRLWARWDGMGWYDGMGWMLCNWWTSDMQDQLGAEQYRQGEAR